MTINFKNWEQTTPKSIEQVDEALKGDQHKLDVDKDGKIEKSDLKKLRSKKRDTIVFNNGEEMRENETCGKKMYREFMEELSSLVETTYGWEVPEPKEKPKSNVRKIAGKAYGGSAQKDDNEDDEEDKPKSQEKRGRGRPAGSKSGARQQGNGNKSYSGLPFHSLNLPSKK